MATSNSKFPRGLRVLIALVILAVLVWFTRTTIYFHYCLGVAVIILGLVIFITYRPHRISKKDETGNAQNKLIESNEDAARDELESESLKENDIAAVFDESKTITIKPRNKDIAPVAEQGESPIPLIEDKSTLTLEEKNTLVNSVWYRCENPFCKFTSFLSVHHIVEGNDEDQNKLANLIVLCPYCHDLAHRGEIPEKEMREWISDRQERWKFKPEWKYY
jgi:hypothetical protein